METAYTLYILFMLERVGKKIAAVSASRLARASLLLGIFANLIMFGLFAHQELMFYRYIADDSLLVKIVPIARIAGQWMFVVMGLAGITIGIYSIVRLKKNNRGLKGVGVAIAGTVISGVPIALVIYGILFLFFGNWMA